jgi:hypothetical protein
LHNKENNKMTDTAVTTATATEEVTEDAEFEAYSGTDEETKAVGKTDVGAVIKGLNDPDSGLYTSIRGNDFATKKAVAAAVLGSQPIGDHLGETLHLKDVIVLPVDLANSATGEIDTAPRVILIDKDGAAFHGTSIGMLSAVRNIFAVLGEPAEWPETVPVKIIRKKGNNKFHFFTIELV